MRLTLVIASLGRGGAERTASVLASGWASRGNQVTIITLARDDVPAYALHPAVQLRQLKVLSGRAKNLIHGLARQLRCVHVLRKALIASEPELVIGFMDVSNVVTLLAARGMSAPVVITEHVHPAFHYVGWHWQTLRRLLYHRADTLVCVSQPLLEWFQGRIKVRGRVIPNPVALPFPAVGSSVQQGPGKNEHVIVGMGRLVEQKGFDLLLEAFARVAERHPDWVLKILGDGPLMDQLRALAQKLGLAGRVEFMGAVADPFRVLRNADLFVFSSRFEGFGNALCEAMACGLPAISFDCPSGPSDIIRSGIDGVLVPAEDVTALADSMDRLMSDPQERLKLAAQAPEVASRFGVEKILDIWQQVFADVLAGRQSKGAR
jgi:GalNAc-alpha-(1->4)-GalNAc-alpha-(1->3)-diNAcBac-PP-undecaprenol alpha-1,4-N-acetyl-D-galactosaminyltransferase